MTTLPRWRQITPDQREILFTRGHVNGCGPKTRGLHRVIPDRLLGLHLEEDCYHHDWNYLLGGSEADRIKADWQFYERMRDRAKQATQRWWSYALRPFYLLTAWTYYRAVRAMGASSFHYGGMTPEEFRRLFS